MKVYLFLDEEGFCTGWGSNEELESVEYDVTDEDVLSGIRKYRYSDGELVYDETKALKEAKDAKSFDFKKSLTELIEKGFYIELGGETFKFTYNESKKSYLSKVYELMNIGLVDRASFTLERDGKEVIKDLEKTNIVELWLLSYLHEEECQKRYNSLLVKLELSESISELMDVKF